MIFVKLQLLIKPLQYNESEICLKAIRMPWNFHQQMNEKISFISLSSLS